MGNRTKAFRLLDKGGVGRKRHGFLLLGRSFSREDAFVSLPSHSDLPLG
jgi:hypothetical protein